MSKVYEKEKWPEIYLDWFNNFLTIQHFAYYYDISREHANEIIEMGRKTDNFTKEI